MMFLKNTVQENHHEVATLVEAVRTHPHTNWAGRVINEQELSFECGTCGWSHRIRVASVEAATYKTEGATWQDSAIHGLQAAVQGIRMGRMNLLSLWANSVPTRTILHMPGAQPTAWDRLMSRNDDFD